MARKYFDEWARGDRDFHRRRRTVTEEDDYEIKSLSYLVQPLPGADEPWDEVGCKAVDKTFVLAVTIGIPSEVMLGVTVSKSEYDNLQMPKPVHVGDVLRVETQVVEMKRSRLRSGTGIITFEHVTKNQGGDVVCQCLHRIELRARPQHDDNANACIALPEFLRRRV
ncbi:acyl dehydratase [Aminobacter niigataensis]|uniref:Acyl dehydratase n=1 Tax=Aminobacter niigataensis TaxID=83265 RepID=A0ABR6L943_9HYPH|nr:MaoC family dehydratase [Aminobacter niigataensis]MBB4653328.1 acyl dehydratase [Aminobacter niigataensis]